MLIGKNEEIPFGSDKAFVPKLRSLTVHNCPDFVKMEHIYGSRRSFGESKTGTGQDLAIVLVFRANRKCQEVQDAVEG